MMVGVRQLLSFLCFIFLFNACSTKDKNIEPSPLDLIHSSSRQTENLIIVTLDGLRWQEVFKGIDPYLLNNNEEAKENKEEIINNFGISSEEQSRRNLMPFIWETVAKHGQVYGNRAFGSNVNVSNPYWLSYPGYNEIFTGKVNLQINNNVFGVSPDYNILEFLNHQDGFEGNKVAAVTNWPKFKDILNIERNGLFVLAGSRSNGSPVNQYVRNNADKEIVSFIDSLPFKQGNIARFKEDKLVYTAAKDLLIRDQPRVMYMSFSATDKYGHSNEYKSYLESAYNINILLKDLWDYTQQDSYYKDKTTLFITVDHGRGEKNNWAHHSSRVKGSDQTWFAVIGPDTDAKGEMKEKGQWYQKQMAKVFAEFLGLNYEGFIR